MEDTARVFNCNMELALDIIGGKWKPILIYHIGNKGPLRYGQLKRLIPSISERVLSRELKDLENKKIICKTVYNEKILRVEYELTQTGLDVLPVLNALTRWGRSYNKEFNYARIILG